MKKSSALIAGFAVLLAVPSCHRSAVPPPPAVGGAPASREAVRVMLSWDAPVDLDLYVTDPALESVYFANTPAKSGGRLEKDSTCAAPAEGVRQEVVAWPSAPPGRYRVSVDFMDRCGRSEREIGYRLFVDAAGRRLEKIGTAGWANRFMYQAFEFDVGDARREESPAK